MFTEMFCIGSTDPNKVFLVMLGEGQIHMPLTIDQAKRLHESIGAAIICSAELPKILKASVYTIAETIVDANKGDIDAAVEEAHGIYDLMTNHPDHTEFLFKDGSKLLNFGTELKVQK